MSEGNRDYNDIYMPTVPQQKAISILFLPFCMLSFLGSTAIAVYVLRDKKRSTYRRLMLSIAICDMISTTGFALQPFLGPADSIRPYAYFLGTDATCTLLGAFTQFSWSTHLYTSSLSFYFVLTVRYGIRDEVFAKKLEPWIHIAIMTWSLSTATIGVVLDAYHESETSPSCWVGAKPGEDCWNDSCGAERLAWIFGGIPNVFCFFSVTINNILLYRYVRRIIATSQRNARLAERRMSTEISQQGVSSKSTQSKETVSSGNSKQADPSQRIENKESGEQPLFASFRSRKPKSILRSSDKQWQRVRQVGIQSFLYVSSYVLCFGPTVVRQMLDGRGIEKEDKDTAERIFLPLLFIQSILLPSQGTFFCIIFFRPKYLEFRKKQPTKTRIWAARSAIEVNNKRRVIVIQEPAKAKPHAKSHGLKAVDENNVAADDDSEDRAGSLSEMSGGSSVDSVMPSVTSRVETSSAPPPGGRRSIISILSGASHRRSTPSSASVTTASISCASDLKLSNTSVADNESSSPGSASSESKTKFLKVNGIEIPVTSSLYST